MEMCVKYLIHTSTGQVVERKHYQSSQTGKIHPCTISPPVHYIFLVLIS